MNQPALSTAHLETAFPFYFCLSLDMRLIGIGPSLKKMLPDLALNTHPEGRLHFVRPSLPFSPEALRSVENRLVILSCTDLPARWRGQIIYDQDNGCFLFLGSPFFDNSTEMVRAGLSLNDYAAHDPINEMLQIIATQQAALAEAQTFAEQVEQSNRGLQEQNLRWETVSKELQTIFDTAVDAILAISENGHIQQCNKAAEQLFGYTTDLLLGKNLSDLIPDIPRLRYQTLLRKMMQTKKGTDGGVGEFTVQHQTGKQIPVRLSIGETNTGETRGFICILHDMSATKAVESLMLQLSSRLRTVLNSLPVGVLLEDEDRRVVLVNPAFQQMFDLEDDAAIIEGMDCSGVLIPPADRFQQAELYSVITKALVSDKNMVTNEIYVLRDGRVVARDYVPVRHQGMDLGHLWWYRDITAMKKNEEAHLADEQRLRAILNTALDAILTIDELGMITEWNQAAADLFGWSRDEAMGRDLAEMIIPEIHRNAHTQGMKHLRETGQAKILDQRLELTAVRRDGSVFPCELAVTQVKGADQDFYTGFIRDISDRDKAASALEAAKESAESANRAKSQFLARMSHEMRTPLNVVLGMIELARGRNLDEEATSYLGTASRGGEQLLFLINDFLDQSKIESGLLNIDQEPFDLAEVADNVTQLTLPEAVKKNIEFKVIQQVDPPHVFLGDGRRIAQILINLANNAIKFTQEGKVTLTIRWDRNGGHREGLLFEVDDTGVGISEADQEKIFTQFYQVDQSASRRFGGTGLGLAICSSLAELMGGRTWLHQSKLGEGSSFRVFIPTERTEPKMFQQGPHPEEEASSSLRVILAEDNPESRVVAGRFLQKMGHWSFAVGDGGDVLTARRQIPADLILMDLEMPTLDGITATRRIREWEERLGRPAIPIIALTAHALKDVRDQCFEVGMNGFLSKPVRPKELSQTLQQWHRGEPLIMIIDDDRDAVKILLNFIESTGDLRGCFFHTPKAALTYLENAKVDLIILDYNLPGANGVETARAIREKVDAPILMHTGLDIDLFRHEAAGINRVSFLAKPASKERFLSTVRRQVVGKTRAAAAPVKEVLIDPELFGLAHGYLENRKQQVADLIILLDQNDFAALKKAAHNIKGTAGTYGFAPLGEMAKELETYVAQEAQQDAHLLLKRMQDYLNAVDLKQED